jgi:hypothetical protein
MQLAINSVIFKYPLILVYIQFSFARKYIAAES